MDAAKTALEQAKAVAAGETTAAALVETAQQQIERNNPALNAIITRADEQAQAEAAHWDCRRKAGDKLPPLAGVPVAIKDNQHVAGLRTTLGSTRHLNAIAPSDAGIVARLRAAGAIVVGKTNLPEYSIGANTVNPAFGATGNPFDPKASCGGSSGGSAVAVAADMVKLATGSDHGGSLRIPAGFCGIVAFRASPGVVPNEERRTPATHYSLQGPMAQTVEDAALMLSVIADRRLGGNRDPMAFPLDAARFRALDALDTSRLRLAVSADLGGLLVSAQTRDLFTDRIERLSRAAAFAALDWHDLNLTDAPGVDWLLRQDVFVSQYYQEADTWPEDFSPNVHQTYDAARQTSMQDIAKARHRQLNLIHRMHAVFDSYDALIVPCVGVQPFEWRHNYPPTVDGQVIKNYMAWLHLTSSLTVVGNPVVALPLGVDETGLPFGVQVIGPRFDDHRLLSIAAALQALGGRDQQLARPVPSLKG
ncbi:MAG: amidase [Alphaproteobacteria bacterium TMED89]|nr:amidase [Rhodospirillaceae bacterium]RPH17502.1 MAG: amidase [Alphaproteobacteria bacterium TMED89]